MTRVSPLHFHCPTLQGPVVVYPQDVVAICWLAKNNCVSLIMSGGGSIPVDGSLDEVEQKITAAKAATYQQEA